MSLLSSASAWLASVTAGARTPAPVPPALATVPPFAARSAGILREFFVCHGIPAETAGAWVTFPGQPYRAQEAMRHWPWPASADFSSIRLFLIIRDHPIAPAPPTPA